MQFLDEDVSNVRTFNLYTCLQALLVQYVISER
jgi:hypothetical protein